MPFADEPPMRSASFDAPCNPVSGLSPGAHVAFAAVAVGVAEDPPPPPPQPHKAIDERVTSANANRFRHDAVMVPPGYRYVRCCVPRIDRLQSDCLCRPVVPIGCQGTVIVANDVGTFKNSAPLRLFWLNLSTWKPLSAEVVQSSI